MFTRATVRLAVTFAIVSCLTLPARAGDDQHELIDRAVSTLRELRFSPESRTERGLLDSERVAKGMAPTLAAIEYEVLTLEECERLAKALSFNREFALRTADRLDVLAEGDSVDAGHAALVRMQLLLDVYRPGDQRTVDAVQAAMTHRSLGEALHQLGRPSDPFFRLQMLSAGDVERILPELLEHGAQFPLDAPCELVDQGLLQYYRVIERAAGPEQADEVQRVRRRFVDFIARALSRLEDDDVVVRQLQRFNPRLDAEHFAASSIEQQRRHTMNSARQLLATFTGASVRDALIGMPMPRIEFLWSHRPSDRAVRARFTSTNDLRGRPTLLVGTVMAALFDEAPDHMRAGIEQIQAVAERFRGQPIDVVVLVEPWHYPLATGYGQTMDPPQNMFEAVREVAASSKYDFTIALVSDMRHPDLGGRGWPILLDHELNVVETDVRVRDLDDLTERLNELLIDASLVASDDPSLPKLERTAVVGEPAPELEFQWTSAGLEASSLRDLRGKIIVLDFWATWCGPCIAAFPHMREIREHYDEDEVVIIGVTSLQGTHVTPDRERIDTADDPEREYELMIEFMNQKDMTWEVAFTKQNVFNKDYGVRGIPSVFVIDQQGVLRSRRLHPMAGEAQIRRLINELLAEQSD